MAFTPKFLATGIGSMPFEDPERAVDVSLARLPEAPFWPQLPHRSPQEQMEIQYSEGMPRLVTEWDKGRIHFDTSGDCSEELARFYEVYLSAMDPDEGSGECSAMAISPDFAKGLYALEARLQARETKLPFVKVHTTGPLSFALTVVDEQKRAIYYNEEFRDAVVKALAMKCRWQVKRFQPFAEKVLCFVDEPILSAFGSSTYVSVTREDVVALLGEMIEAIHADAGIAGVHCCGNTEWSLLTDAGADIVSFDAFTYGESIAMYPDAVRAHLERGGALAWGAVPTSAAVREETAETLVTHLERMIDGLAAHGIDRQLILEQGLVTPSCGTGSMEGPDAELVFERTAEVSARMRDAHGWPPRVFADHAKAQTRLT